MKQKRGFRPAVFIVVYYLDKKTQKPIYLLLKRKLHWKGWEFPKGGNENSETSRQTAIREAKEETNLKLIKLRKFKVSGKYRYTKELPDRKGIAGQTYVLFSAEVRPGNIKFDKKEHSGFRWTNFKTALKMLTWNNQKKCLRIVDKSLSKK